MSNCVIVVTEFQDGPTLTQVKVLGQAKENSRGHLIGWDALINYDSTPSQFNTAVVNAVIAEFARAEPPIIIAGQDRKILFGGAV